MSDRAFVDTNVLVSMFDTHEPQKQALAQHAFAEVAVGMTLSSQILGELYVVLTRKLVDTLPPATAAVVIRELSRFDRVVVDSALVNHAIQLSLQYALSYWDALVVAAAIRSGCEILLTVDLNHGQSIEGVEIRNPFRHSG